MSIPIKQLVVIGDSSVYGWGDREEGGWCERLRKRWMKIPGAPILYPLGIRGDGLEKAAKRWKREWESRGELRRKVPQGLLLSIGLNDSARIGSPTGRPQLSAEAYRFGLGQLLRDIKKETEVMVLGITAVDEEVMPFAECLWYSNDACSIYESQIEEACLEVDVPFMPIHKSMLSEPNWIRWLEPDGIHLNEIGHHWISEKVAEWDVIKEFGGMTTLNTITP